MKKKMKPIILSIYVLLLAGTLLIAFFSTRTYTLYIPNPENSTGITLEHVDGETGVIYCDKTVQQNTCVKVCLKAAREGQETVGITISPYTADVSSYTVYAHLQAGDTGIIYSDGYGFDGYKFLYLGIGLMECFTCALFLRQFFYRKNHGFYSYKTVLDAALFLYCGIRGTMYTVLFTFAVARPADMDNMHMYEAIGLMMSLVAIASIPILFVFSVFLVASNLSLIRHEGLMRNNLFGILISLLLGTGSVACVLLVVWFPQALAADGVSVIMAMVRTLAASIFVYFGCLLASVQFCCLYSAKRKVKYDKDFIIILGCKTRKDGTPLPLLQGRIDRALQFYTAQLKTSGKQAYFIPSGGQGNDEIMPEAESMKRYLMAHGVEQKWILPETKSTTTLENMRFSSAIAHRNMQQPNIVFSTTNYHIFRSGILSRKAGLQAEGIGAKTKWYFWMNAQIREFIGLLAAEFKVNTAVVIAVSLISVLLANIGTILSWLIQNT